LFYPNPLIIPSQVFNIKFLYKVKHHERTLCIGGRAITIASNGSITSKGSTTINTFVFNDSKIFDGSILTHQHINFKINKKFNINLVLRYKYFKLIDVIFKTSRRL